MQYPFHSSRIAFFLIIAHLSCTRNEWFKKAIYRSFLTIASKILPSDYEDSLGVQGSDISYTEDVIKISNVVGFCGDKIKEAFSFSADGTFNKYNIDYVNKK